MAQWVASEHLKCTLKHKLQQDYPPFMMILTLLAFLPGYYGSIQFFYLEDFGPGKLVWVPSIKDI